MNKLLRSILCIGLVAGPTLLSDAVADFGYLGASGRFACFDMLANHRAMACPFCSAPSLTITGSAEATIASASPAPSKTAA